MIEHLPILQVLVPLLGAPLCIMVRNPQMVGFFALSISTITFLVSCSLLQQVLQNGTIVYELGGWAAPWGIEYRYVSPGANGSFDISSYGADSVPGGEGATWISAMSTPTLSAPTNPASMGSTWI